MFESELKAYEQKIIANDKTKSIVIALESCGELGKNVTGYLENIIYPVHAQFMKFGNNEINIFPADSVRKKDIFIIASGSNIDGSINDHLMTLFGIIRACKCGSAAYITVICTYLPYSRSDKKDQGRTPIMAKLVCDFIETAGADRLVTVDLHASQIQGFFNGPFDNLYAINPLMNIISEKYSRDDLIIVSPDAGGEKRANAWASKLNAPYTFFTKSRNHQAVSTIVSHQLVHQLDFENKIAMLIDDMGDTLGTLNSAAKILKEKGAKEVIAVVTHGVLSGKALENLNNGYLDKLYVTNTISQKDNLIQTTKLEVVDISLLLSQAIFKCITAGSISELFD